MEKYLRVQKPRDKAPENEVKINKNTPISNYVRYILSLFKEKNAQEVVIKSMGDAITKIISIAEIIKHRIKGIH